MEKDGKTNKEAKGEQDQGPPPDNKSLKDQVNRLLKVGKGMCVRWTAQNDEAVEKVLDAMTPVEALKLTDDWATKEERVQQMWPRFKANKGDDTYLKLDKVQKALNSVQKAGADPLSNLGSAVFTRAMQAVHEKVGSSEEFKNAKDKEKSHILR